MASTKPSPANGSTRPGASLSYRVVVSLRGEYDSATVDRLSETLARAMAIGDNDLTVDLSEVRFMDGATVGVISRAHEVLQQMSRSLVLRAPSTSARRVVELCGGADLIASHPDDATTAAGTPGALGTWVTVPTTDRGGPVANASEPRRGTLTSARNVSSTVAAGPPEGRTTVADLGGT